MTESGNPDRRGRPQFGEYATPEQQRAAIRVPAAQSDEPVPVPERHDHRTSPLAPPSFGPGGTTSEAAAARRRADRLATYLLLGVGFVSVLTTIPTLLQLPRVIGDVFEQFGIDAFTQTALAQTTGWVLLAVQIALWALALVLSLRALARERVAWWIPFVIGVVANLVLMIGMSLVMIADPAFTEYVSAASAG